ncbi:MAG: hypothetical protein IKB35_01370 [Clostridia bacterium]|nr:hypothetical protein [Clostridia bacterium]
MIETTQMRVIKLELDKEVALINQMARFGWNLTLKTAITGADVSGTASETKGFDLTFQRDTNMSNYDQLNEAYLRFKKQHDRIEETAKKASIKKLVYVVCCCAVTLIAVNPIYSLMNVWDDEFSAFLFGYAVILGALVGGGIGLPTMILINKLKVEKAVKAIIPSVYSSMEAISLEAMQYLPKQ